MSLDPLTHGFHPCLLRSDHLYVFFIHWNPDTYGEGLGAPGRDPGFMVVKKNQEPEGGDELSSTDEETKEWEVKFGD